ncbi:MAG: glycine oxidase ThiO [Polyangiaceae bacterium]
MRVIVVGAGIMGCATALELEARGAEVTLLERAVPGAEASSAAAGILGAQAEAHEPGPHFVRMLRARDGYVASAARLTGATADDIGYRKSGVLKLAFDEREDEALRAIVTWQASGGAKGVMLSGDALHDIEPAVSPHAVSAAYFEDDAQVEPVRLLSALVRRIQGNSIVVRTGAIVTGFHMSGATCTGVVLDGKETLTADAVVLAAGSWSSVVPGAPHDAQQVKPIRGQMIELRETPSSLGTILFGQGTYVVPRGDGRVVCGSTMEDVGFTKEVTTAGLRHVLSGAMHNAPGLGTASFVRTWSNFRPHAPGGPLVGKSETPGLFLATGHFRNGILLAFDTAETVARAVYE